jgi:hypothetical protein
MSDFPNLSESWCPWCEKRIEAPRLLRHEGDSAEYQCPRCGGKHTRRRGIEDAVQIFYPADIAAALDCDLEPLAL